MAAEAGAEPLHMTRLLRALSALGLLKENTPGTFSATAAGALLDPGRPDSLASFVRMFTEPAILRAWEHLDGSVRTGEIAFDTVFGTDFFSHLATHPELSSEFNAAMSQVVEETAVVLPQAFDFGRFTRVTDVGGGDGTLLARVLDAHPGLTGVVFDTAEGLAQAPATLAWHGLEARCSVSAGDFFRAVPEGSDLYMMKSVLHDWTDEQAVTILRHCSRRAAAHRPCADHRARASRGRRPRRRGRRHRRRGHVSERPQHAGERGGRERTRTDFEDLCLRAGLSVTAVTPLPEAAPFSLIEAVPDR